MRRIAVLVHRYVGLVMAGFLLLAGLSGALLVWYHDLDAALNPRLMRVTPPPTADGRPPQPLDALLLRERVQAAYPAARVNYVSFHQGAPADARPFFLEPATEGVALAADEVFVDPYTGAILGDRRWGDIGQGLVNLMPFVYRLHYSLALGTVGTWIFGIVALLWTLDCFLGAWLTLPARGHPGKSWWARWKPAWGVRWRASSHKLNFDLHRAGGLWPWALLLVIAWSSVAFNLYEPVYRPVMGALLTMQPDPRTDRPALPRPEPEPALGWPAALAAARQHMAAVAAEKGVRVLAEDRLSYDPQKGYLRYVARTDRDVNENRGQSAVFIDSRSGALIAVRLPTGEAAGDTVTSWIMTLHMAQLWGLPFRLVMTVTGLAVALLSVTGVLIWWRKRRARHARVPGVARPAFLAATDRLPTPAQALDVRGGER